MSAAGNGGCKWAIEALIMSRSELCLIVHGPQLCKLDSTLHPLSTEMNTIAMHSSVQTGHALNGVVVVVVVIVVVVVGAIPKQDNSLVQLEQVAMPACSSCPMEYSLQSHLKALASPGRLYMTT